MPLLLACGMTVTKIKARIEVISATLRYGMAFGKGHDWNIELKSRQARGWTGANTSELVEMVWSQDLCEAHNRHDWQKAYY